MPRIWGPSEKSWFHARSSCLRWTWEEAIPKVNSPVGHRQLMGDVQDPVRFPLHSQEVLHTLRKCCTWEVLYTDVSTLIDHRDVDRAVRGLIWHNVFIIDFRKSTPPQNRLEIFICNNKQQVDGCVGRLTFKN